MTTVVAEEGSSSALSPVRKEFQIFKAKAVQPLTTCEDYFFENGFRFVKPYEYFHKIGPIKKRQCWIGMTLDKFYACQFPSIDRKIIVDAVQSGEITINGCKVSLTQGLIKKDMIWHRMKKAEPPVLGTYPLEFLEVSEEVVVINKPATIPVHHVGEHVRNTIIEILEREYGFQNLFQVHRLDVPTSGMLIVCRSKAVVHKIQQLMLDKKVHKIYIARVIGDFPQDYLLVEANIGESSVAGKMLIDEQNGKYAKTAFFKIGYDEKTNTSLLLCKLYTGRTHQIRLHTRHVGYPIVNDTFYGPYARLLQIQKKQMKLRETVMMEATLPFLSTAKLKKPTTESPASTPPPQTESTTNSVETTGTSTPSEQVAEEQETSTPSSTTESTSEQPPKTRKPFNFNKEQLYLLSDSIACLRLYLHSWIYVLDDKIYQSSIPEWARADFDEEKIFEVLHKLLEKESISVKLEK